MTHLLTCVCMGSHLGLAVPVERVSLEHKPAAAPARAHEAPGHLAQQEPAVTVRPAQLPAGHPPAAQLRRHACSSIARLVSEGLAGCPGPPTCSLAPHEHPQLIFLNPCSGLRM